MGLFFYFRGKSLGCNVGQWYLVFFMVFSRRAHVTCKGFNNGFLGNDLEFFFNKMDLQSSQFFLQKEVFFGEVTVWVRQDWNIR